MNKLLITGCLLATAIAAVAMPTKKELAAAQKLVADVIAPDVKALNAGRKTVKDVADVQMKLAADARSEAEKYFLLQSAFKLYSRGEEFDSAAKALTAITRDIKDVPPELITELVDKEYNRDMGLKAPKEIEAMVSRIADGGAKVINGKATVDGYTWSYRVNNGEAEIVAENGGKFSCAVSPSPKGDVTIPSTLGGVSVTRIGQCAFKDCKGMSSVKIPSTVKSFGSWGVFAGCSGLTSVVIPDGVKSIEECAFWGCSNLKSVTIPPSVTKISDAAFGCCGGLASLTIPPTVKELRTQVFFGCGALTSVTIPASVEKIGWAAFVYSGELKEINVDPKNKWFTSVDGALYTKDLTELVACPNALTSLMIHPSVKKLRAAAIISCGKLESLTIPEGVTEIGWQAIKDCGSLKMVTIPSTVRRIAEIAFCNCRSLTSVTIPESVLSIGKRAFENCGALTSVTMRGERPNSSGDIFPKCANLKSIHVPANAKSWAGMKEWQGIPLVFDDDTESVAQGQATIDGYTWSYRVNNGEAEIVSPTGKLGECAVSPKPTGDVTIPATLGGARVTSIGNSAFAYCREITSVTIPSCVTNISRWAFYQCWHLDSVVIPEGVTSIKALAFEDCWYGLTSVTIPSTVTEIGWCAFAGNSGKLMAFEVSSANPKYASVNGLLCSKDGKTVIAGVNGNVKIPESVTSIGDGAFRKYSGLTSVTIPSSVKFIGKESFSNCGGLTSVTMRGEKPDSGDKVFDKCGKLRSIHVPAKAKSWAGMKEWQGIPLVFDVK